MIWFVLYLFFFFQAEDGIRDYKVTGVQTCALPIGAGVAHLEAQIRGLRHRQTMVEGNHNHARLGQDVLQLVDQIGFLRSIHANSKLSSGIAPERASTNARSELRALVSVGW